MGNAAIGMQLLVDLTFMGQIDNHRWEGHRNGSRGQDNAAILCFSGFESKKASEKRLPRPEMVGKYFQSLGFLGRLNYLVETCGRFITPGADLPLIERLNSAGQRLRYRLESQSGSCTGWQ